MKKKNHRRAIVFLNGDELSCSSKQLDFYVSSLKTKLGSWFTMKKEALLFIKTDLKRKKKIFITKGYSHPGLYEVWHN